MLLNRTRCKKCGDVITSNHVHDFVRCKCGAVAVDGGDDYLRRIGNPEDMEELSMNEEQIVKGAKKRHDNPIKGLSIADEN